MRPWGGVVKAFVATGFIIGYPLAGAVIPVHAATATTYSVDCGRGRTCPMKRLQKVIDESSDGDTILVNPGTYSGYLNFNGKSVTVMSTKGPALTILAGRHKNSVVTFENNETSDAVLQGVTVEDGSNSYGGGGIYIAGGASPTIRNDVVTRNVGCGGGAGIYVWYGDSLITDNTIEKNVGGSDVGCSGGGLDGGGILADGGDPTIIDNVIVDNTMDAGAGVAVSYGAALIEDNVIEGNNNDGSGGSSGIELYSTEAGTKIIQNVVVNEGTGTQSSEVRVATDDPAVLVNNTIVAAADDYAVWVDDSSSPPRLINNIIEGDQVPLGCGSTYSVNPYLSHNDVWGPSSATGICAELLDSQSNISVAAHFARLRSLNLHETASSPTVNAGENSDADYPFRLPATDLSGQPRIVGGTVEMGAYEYQGQS
jgi:hypothetical protein